MRIPIRDILVDPSVSIRPLDPDTLGQYIAMDGSVFPPVDVFGSSNLLADGFHRVEAAKRRPDADIEATVHEVADQSRVRIEAEDFAAVANFGHGRPLTKTEKHEAIERLLRHDMTVEVVAAKTGMSVRTIGEIANALRLSGILPATPTKRATGGPRNTIQPLPSGVAGSLKSSQKVHIARLPEDEQRQTIAKAAVSGGWDTRVTQSAVEDVKHGIPMAQVIDRADRAQVAKDFKPAPTPESILRGIKTDWDQVTIELGLLTDLLTAHPEKRTTILTYSPVVNTIEEVFDRLEQAVMAFRSVVGDEPVIHEGVLVGAGA